MRLRWVLAAVSMALFCVQIDYFAMNLALPRMAFDLKTTAPDLQWVISVYMLALGASVTSLVAVARCWQASHCSGCPPRCVRWGRRRHSSSPSAPSTALVPR